MTTPKRLREGLEYFRRFRLLLAGSRRFTLGRRGLGRRCIGDEGTTGMTFITRNAAGGRLVDVDEAGGIASFATFALRNQISHDEYDESMGLTRGSLATISVFAAVICSALTRGRERIRPPPPAPPALGTLGGLPLSS